MSYYGHVDKNSDESPENTKKDREYVFLPPSQYDVNQERLALQAYQRYLKRKARNDKKAARDANKADHTTAGRQEDSANKAGPSNSKPVQIAGEKKDATGAKKLSHSI